EISAAARLLQCLRRVPDPRSKHGVSHTFHTVIAIVIPGLPAGISTIAEILERISIKDLQNAFAQFLNGLLNDEVSVAARMFLSCRLVIM
ncbi:MAG: transposase family protein, partial [Planctomycetaceae bacterium]|nr:transposase family protein [Planctomycetaceae bacterium]